MTNFPSSLDSTGSTLPTVATGTDNLNASSNKRHDTKHNMEDGAIIAVETKLGTGSSTATSNTVLTGTGTGTSGWAQVATGMIASGAVTQGASGSNVSDVTTTSTAFQDATSISATLTTTGGDVLVGATFTGQNDTGGDTWEAKIHFSGGDSNPHLFQSTESTYSIVYRFTGVSAGTYTFIVQFKVTSAGTARILGARNSIYAIELKK